MNGININLTITSPDLHDAFLALAEAINNMGSPFRVPAIAENPNTGVAVGKVMENDSVEVAAPVKAQKAVEPVNPYTLQQIAIWAVALQEKNQQRLMDILRHFGIQALTQLPPERYGEFVQMLALEGVVNNAR